MKKMRLLAMVSAVALAGSGAAFVATPAFAGQQGGGYEHDKKCVVAEPRSIDTWLSLSQVVDVEGTQESWSVVGDFSQSSGDGSAHWSAGPSGLTVSTDAAGHRKVAGYLDVPNFPLANATDWSLGWTGTDPQPGGQLLVDITGDGVSDGILVGEPVYGGNWWLTNGSAAAFKALDPSGANDGGNGSAYFGTLAEWSAAITGDGRDATVTHIGFSLGSGITGSGVVSGIHVNGGDHGFTQYHAAVPTTYKWELDGGSGEGPLPANTEAKQYIAGEPKTWTEYVKSDCDLDYNEEVVTAGDCETQVDTRTTTFYTWDKEKIKVDRKWVYLLTPNEPWSTSVEEPWSAERIEEECPASPVLVTPTLEYTPAGCETSGTLTLGEHAGIAWSSVLNEDNSQVIRATALEGFTIPEGTQIEWTIPALSPLGYQTANPEASCYQVGQPAAPTWFDNCGTENDEYVVPGNTDEFYYEDFTEGATVTVTANLRSETAEWADGVVTEWSHTFTDEDCPVDTPEPSTPPLAATGGGNVSPLVPLGGGIAVMLGLVLGAIGYLRRRMA